MPPRPTRVSLPRLIMPPRACACRARASCLPTARISCSSAVPLVERIRGARKCAYVIAQDGMEKPKLLAGVSGEAFVLEAAAMGLDTCWVTGTYRRGEVPQEMLSDGRAADRRDCPGACQGNAAADCAPSQEPVTDLPGRARSVAVVGVSRGGGCAYRALGGQPPALAACLCPALAAPDGAKTPTMWIWVLR